MVSIVEYVVRDRVAHITLNRPDKLNAFSNEMTKSLRDTLRRFDADDEAWVGLLSGRGRAFSSGADAHERHLQEPSELKHTNAQSLIEDHRNHGFLERSSNWKPVIGVAHGYAMGAGLALLLECDYSVAATDAQLQVTEVGRGIWGSLHWRMLSTSAGAAFASDVCLTGRFFSGAEAAESGAINSAIEPASVMDEGLRIATSILSNPPLAVRHVVRARRWWLHQAIAEVSVLREGAPLHLTEDFMESTRAFAQKRRPGPFVGR